MEEAYRRYLAMVGAPEKAMDLQTFAVSGLLQAFLEYERRSLINEVGMSSEAFGRFVNSYRATGSENFDEAWKSYQKKRKSRKRRESKPRKPKPLEKPEQPYQPPYTSEGEPRQNPLRRYRRPNWF